MIFFKDSKKINMIELTLILYLRTIKVKMILKFNLDKFLWINQEGHFKKTSRLILLIMYKLKYKENLRIKFELIGILRFLWVYFMLF